MNRFARIFPYYKRYRRELILGWAFIPFSIALDLLIPVAIGKGIDQLRTDPLHTVLINYVSLVLALAIIKGIFRYKMRYLMVGVSRKVEIDVKNDLFAHLNKLSFSYFNTARTGDLLSRATQDVEAVRMFTGPGFMYVSSSLLALPFAFVILIYLNWKLTLFVALPLLGLAYVVKLLTPKISEHSQAIQEELADISNLSQENFAGVRVIKGFHLERSEIGRFEKKCQEYRSDNLKLAKIRGLSDSLIEASKDIAFLLILGIGGMDLIDGKFTLGDYFVFNSFVLQLFWPLISLGWIVGMYHRAAAAMGRIDEIFLTQPEIADAIESKTGLPIQGEIEFRKLSFAYNGNPVLSNISFKIPKGETVGIVGKTGVGKTTLSSLVARLFNPEPGTLFIDGRDIHDIPLEELRQAIGFVPQDNFLFSDTIRENIGFGVEELSQESMVQAAESSKIAEEIRSFPRGFDQMIGERGVNLSGGQKQRVSIARALVKNPKILIFDDALSAVDPETERELIANLHRAATGRTTLLIAHRISVVQDADRIFVLEDGKITEQGSHSELLKKNGWYAQTWKRQQIEQELEVL